MPFELVGAEELISGSMDLDVGATSLIGAPPWGGGGYGWMRGRDGQMHGPGRGHGGGLSQWQQLQQQAAAYKAAQSGVISKSINPTKARRLVLPMSSGTAVTAGSATTVTARPQTIAFKPQRVVIPATIAPDFTLQDIKVGNKSQLAQSGDLPCEAFTQTAFEVAMDMDTVQTSQDFVLQLTNISGANRTFRAAVYGRAADY